jgi:hypothetical protein
MLCEIMHPQSKLFLVLFFFFNGVRPCLLRVFSDEDSSFQFVF